MDYCDEVICTDPKEIDTIDSVESLIHSVAFDHLMYDNRIDRIVQFTSNVDDELCIDFAILNGKFPDEITDVFSGEQVVKDISLLHNEKSDSSITELHFTANGKHHLIKQDTTQGIALHETTNSYGDSVLYSYTTPVATSILASFYMQRSTIPTIQSTRRSKGLIKHDYLENVSVTLRLSKE